MKCNAIMHQAQEAQEGEGVTVKRLFPNAGLRHFDPFVLWDHFTVGPGAGFPAHPHRGFEGITYLFEGSMEHSDKLGNRSHVAAGGAQRFTAGRGIVHAEMPGSAGNNEGIQLWLNLPRSLKGIEPAYQQVDAPALPIQVYDKATLKTIIGEGSPLSVRTACQCMQLDLQAGGEYAHPIPVGYRGLVYNVSGRAQLLGHELHQASAVLLEGCTEIRVRSEAACTLMLCFGAPHNEPIYQHGPFVD